MSRKLLILDDDAAIAATVKLISESAGFEARSTTDPAEFFRLVDEWRPTHIALDLVMPEMDGVQVMARLAREHCDARIIITSGVGSRVLDAAGRSATEHGLVIAGILSKPFTPTALRALLRNSAARLDSTIRHGAIASPPRSADDPTPDELRDAIDGHQLVLAYQPQISADGQTLAGFEALVRWQHPARGTIMPDRFIPMAESCGLIDALTDRVLDLGLGWLARSFPSHDDPDAEISLSINISAVSLGDRDFVEAAVQACARHGIDPGRIILELTESSAMRDPIASLDQLTRMRMKGFQLSIDDFGTGFSSVLQLARLPFSELKVDKSFVIHAMQSVESRAVVRSVVELGRSLGLRTVAEGVEDAVTLEFLRNIGCDTAQGYFIARPMPGDAVTGWLAARQVRAPHPPGPQGSAEPNGPLDKIASFRWDESFVTGIGEVDKQHKQLVMLINRLGGLLLSGQSVTPAAVGALFSELVDYTNYHFREEEALMTGLGLDSRHVDFHRDEHARFVAEVVQLRDSVAAEDPRTLQPVLGFLVHWLAYHILGLDQSMARQVEAIGRGSTAEAAFVSELDHIKGSTEPLVSALHGLLRLVSQRNEELRENNRLLETRVAERTAALGEANRQLAVVAMTDALTGIPNRRHAITMLAHAWDESPIDGRPLACLMVDADHIKEINDTHGHDAGDEVLRGVANQLRDAARTDDIVCRLGGDEFLIIAPATPLDGALQLAEKIRRAVSELRIPAGNGAWHGSVSIGVAVRTGSMATPEELIKAADEAVYVAKAAGRNVVAALDGPITRPD